METVLKIASLVGIPSIISGIFALIISRMLKKRDAKQEQIVAQNEEMERQNKAIMLGVQAFLRDRLLQGYRHYIAKGWADYDDRENMENIYTQYHALGANGIMDDMRNQFRNLPTQPIN
ncbi:MAG: hypothetical protein IJ896_10980 [Fibrobacter sp.]|nr:hypothetical protein [Fibrobacter sp.]